MRKLLWPISWLIYGLSQLRKQWILSYAVSFFPVPIIMVGNISLGGTGKTPFVCALVCELKKRGYRPGVVSRGYKAKYSSQKPHIVRASDRAEHSGDEPLLILSKTKVPVVICKNRPKAVECLVQNFPEINIIISDDGLQHYYLNRDIEIALVNDNQDHLLFPAGSLREPLSRLKSVDFVVKSDQIARRLDESVTLLNNKNIIKKLDSFRGQSVYALAGIAHPENFFKDLKKWDLKLIECPFPDHYNYKQSDFNQILNYAEQYPVLMTEKDAVKFKPWSSYKNTNIWVVALTTTISSSLVDEIINKLNH